MTAAANVADRAVLEGHIAVEAGLCSPYRAVERVLIRKDKPERSVRKVLALAQNQAVPVSWVESTRIDVLAAGQSHGGVLAEAGARRYLTLAELLPSDEIPFIVMVDGVEDPFNFGYTVRTLYAAGVHGLVVRPRNWLSATATVARASAGSSELIPAAVVENAEEAAAFYQDLGLRVACAVKERSRPLDQVDLTQPLFLLIGGERRGITRSFANRADVRIQIPYGRKFRPSLGTVSAAAILAYEVQRQRKNA